MRRRLFTLASLLSLLLCVATVVLWVRGQFAQDVLWKISAASGGRVVVPMIVSDNGRLAVIVRSNPAPNASMPAGRWAYMARPRFHEFEDVRWASYSRESDSATGSVKTQVAVRLWPLVLILALCPLALLRQSLLHRSRPRPGVCSRCRYDLTGNTSGVCPECGTTIPAKT